MAPTRNWQRAVVVVDGLVLLLLVAQYLLGLWTNVYAPAMFTSNSSFPSLDWHYNIGYVLFLVSLVGLILSLLSRQLRLIVPFVVLPVSILSAGEFGADFVSSTPNNPLDSFGMGAMFLVALLAAVSVMYLAGRARPGEKTPSAVPGSAAQPQ